MIPTYWFLFFALLCKIQAQTENRLFNENFKCKCGRSDDHSFRIVGGEEAPAHSHPWMVALYSISHNKIFCGGALINDRYVLTAAHCVKSIKKQGLAVVLGLHDRTAFERKKEGLMIGVEDIKMHEDYKSISFYDIEDIALLRLKERVNFTKKVKPICLPKNKDEDYANKVANVLGWGRLSFRTGKSSRFLREAHLKVVSDNECKKSRIVGRFILDTMLCAYRDKADACQGDSGGPLTYDTASGKVELIGIVSWGIKCAKPGTPGVYTKVTSKLDWIAKNTRDATYCLNV